MHQKLGQICIIGHPGLIGGADTELDHQIRCWQKMGISVHVCHTAALDDHLLSLQLEKRGVIYHSPRDWPSLDGLDCISYCNGEFLSNLLRIRKYARSVTWVNCMTFNFEREIQMHRRGLIDLHLFQTAHAMDKVSPRLRKWGNFHGMVIRPYFHCDDFPFHAERPQDRFRFGRISRADADKFNDRQLWIYSNLISPVPKEGIIVGWSERVAKKFADAPESSIRILPERGMSQQQFYRECDAIIMATDTLENLPRVGFEAMSSGSLLVVDDRGGWRLQVEDGVTGWLCANEQEFVDKASRCAFDGLERRGMQLAARRKLEENWGFEAAARSWEHVFASIITSGSTTAT